MAGAIDQLNAGTAVLTQYRARSPWDEEVRIDDETVALAPTGGRTAAELAATDFVIISFYCGDKYYHDAAEGLRKNCDELAITHDIRELVVSSSKDWIDICRKKISFYKAMLEAHDRPVFWIDVDEVILKYPEFLRGARADIGLFLRNFKFFPHFDKDLYSRLFAPTYLYFNNTDATRQFLGFAGELEKSDPVRATDDYYLQRAFLEWGGRLRFLLFSGDEVCRSPESDNFTRAYFMHRPSRNVSDFIGEAAQHQTAILTPVRQKRVLKAAADEALRNGHTSDAIAYYRGIYRLDRNDVAAYSKILELLARDGQHKKADYHLQRGKKSPTLFRAAWRYELQRAIKSGDYAQVDRVAAKIAGVRDAELDALVKSRLFRVGLNRRADQMGVAMAQRVPLWWMETPYPGNLGDIINPYIIEKLTGVPPVFSHARRTLAIGSVLRFAKAGTRVWGTGSSTSDLRPDPAAVYHAVRGPLSRRIVLDAGGTCPEIYGDPAWVLPRLFRPRAQKVHKLGLIRHAVHRDAPVRLADGVCEIDILRCGSEEIEAFLTELCSCEGIISTSLHGVIIANAYGIPARYCTVSASEKQLHGDGLKFDDYFLSIGLQNRGPLDLSELEVIEPNLLEQCTDNPAVPIDVDLLLENAPFEVRCS